jgi:glyoxylase-like metal-dependent hydrolase (beta-lactamase superfamily II)
MITEQIITRLYAENVWLVGDPQTRQGLIVDPGDQASEIIAKITASAIRPLAILNTHGHPDHLAAAADLQEYYQIPFYLHSAESATFRAAISFGQMLGIPVNRLPEPVTFIENENIPEVAPFQIKVITTPGHTPGSVCYLIDGRLFSGDTLFRNSIGRVDLPGGSWPQMEKSLSKLRMLPPETLVYPGHGMQTTIAHELRHNPYLRPNGSK